MSDKAGVGVIENPYAGQSRAVLRARRKDILSLRQAHLSEAQRCMAESHRIGRALGSRDGMNLTVSDHAVIRWLERVEGVSTDDIRRRIVAAVRAGDAMGDSSLVRHGGVVICIKDGLRVTTVLDATKPIPAPSETPVGMSPKGECTKDHNHER